MDELIRVIKHYDSAHRMFLQLLLRKKIILHADVSNVFQQIAAETNNVTIVQINEDYNKKLVNFLLETLNNKLRVIGLRVLQVPDETRCATDFITLVSDRSYSETFSMTSGLTTEELVSFQGWLKMMFLQEEKLFRGSNASVHGNVIGELKIMKALNSRLGGLSVGAAHKLINKLVEQQWFVVDEARDVVRLHTRAIAELCNSLQLEFCLPTCDLCMQGIFLSRLAHQCTCGRVYHARCIKKVLESPAKCQNRNCDSILNANSFDFDDDVIWNCKISNGQNV